MSYNFEVYHRTKLIFSSENHWLNPIFEFEDFLKQSVYKTEMLEIRDKIIGRAAALLLVRLDIRNIHARLLSEPGKEILEHFNLHFTYNELVPKIGCQTEDLLKNEYDPDVAHRLIIERIESRKKSNRNK